MNQLCKVCGEPAAGFHFGAFTCEGCKSFFGRTYNNISAIAGCKNNGDCVINKKNRTACKACRLRKCLLVGMSKSGSRYGRRSNWFKIHCLLQEQQTQQGATATTVTTTTTTTTIGSTTGSNASLEQLQRLQQIQARQTYQDKTNPCIKTVAAAAAMSPTMALNALQQQHQQHQKQKHKQQHYNQTTQHRSSVTMNDDDNMTPSPPQPQPPPPLTPTHNFFSAAKFFNGIADIAHATAAAAAAAATTQHKTYTTQSRLSHTPSDSGASSAGDPTDDCISTTSGRHHTNSERNCNSAHLNDYYIEDMDVREIRRKQFLQIFRSHSEPLHSPFAPFAMVTHLPPPIMAGTPPAHILPQLKEELKRATATMTACSSSIAIVENAALVGQHEPIDLSVKSTQFSAGSSPTNVAFDEMTNTPTPTPNTAAAATTPQHSQSPQYMNASGASGLGGVCDNNEDNCMRNVIQKTVPLDLTLAMRSSQTLTG